MSYSRIQSTSLCPWQVPSEPLVLLRIHPGQMKSDDEHLRTWFLTFLCVCLISRCNEGNNQSTSWNPAESSHCNRRRVLPKEIQNDLERPPSQDLSCPPPPSPLRHPHALPLLEKHLPIVTNANGRSDLLGRGLGQGLGPGPGGSGQVITSGQCRGLGAGDCGAGLGVGRNPLVQELSELEGQIVVIKQQLQSAMRRKRELEQFQSEHQQAKQTAPSQPSTHQFTQYVQSQQTNQHTNTLPEFWSSAPVFWQRNLTGHGTSSQNLLQALEKDLYLSVEVSENSGSGLLHSGDPLESWTETFSRDQILLSDSGRTLPDFWNQRWTSDPELNLFLLAS